MVDLSIAMLVTGWYMDPVPPTWVPEEDGHVFVGWMKPQKTLQATSTRDLRNGTRGQKKSDNSAGPAALTLELVGVNICVKHFFCWHYLRILVS